MQQEKKIMFYDREFTFLREEKDYYLLADKTNNIYKDSRLLKAKLDDNGKMLNLKMIDFDKQGARSVLEINPKDDGTFEFLQYADNYEEIRIDDNYVYDKMFVKCIATLNSEYDKEQLEIELKKSKKKKIVRLIQDKRINYRFYDKKEYLENNPEASEFRIISKSIQLFDVFLIFGCQAFRSLEKQLGDLNKEMVLKKIKEQ